MILKEIELPNLEGESKDKLLEILAYAFWMWFYANLERKVTLRLWFFNKTIRVKDLEQIFILFFGDTKSDKSL